MRNRLTASWDIPPPSLTQASQGRGGWPLSPWWLEEAGVSLTISQDLMVGRWEEEGGELL